MKKTALRMVKVLFLRSGLGICLLAVSCSQIFNPSFLTNTGLQTGAAQQTTPDLPNLLVLKLTNQTDYPANVTMVVKRSVPTGEDNFTALVAPGQTVGKLFDNCNSATNPVLSLFVPLITDASSQIILPLGQAYVTVNGLPVVIPANELPGTLNVNQHFKCGDTVEFVVHPSFTDINRFRVSALVFAGTQ